MNRPEYWEDDETWAAYEEQQKTKEPPKPEPLPGLKAAIDRARGNVPIEESIRFLNAMSAILCGRTRSGSDSAAVPPVETEHPAP